MQYNTRECQPEAAYNQLERFTVKEHQISIYTQLLSLIRGLQ